MVRLHDQAIPKAAALLGLTLLFCGPVDAVSPTLLTCDSAVVALKAQQHQLASALRVYSSCVLDPSSRDACSEQFLYVVAHQRDFRSAVIDQHRLCQQ